MLMGQYEGSAASVEREKWSDSDNKGKRALGKIGIGLKGIWEALPAF